MQAERLWQAALGQLQVEMPRAKFETWIRDAELLSYEDGEFVIGVKHAFARDWLDDRLRPTIKRVPGGLGVTGASALAERVAATDDEKLATCSRLVCRRSACDATCHSTLASSRSQMSRSSK